MIFSVENGKIVFDSMNTSLNLLSFGTWEVDIDTYGSSVDTGDAIINEGIAKASFNIVASNVASNEWAHGSLSCKFPSGYNLEQAMYLKLTFNSSTSCKLILFQKGFANQGESYEVSLPDSNGKCITSLIPLDEITHQDKVLNHTLFNLALVNAISFLIESKGTIEIKEMIMYNKYY